MSKGYRARSRRGFSLVELMMVVLIMLAIAAIAIPQISTFISGYRLRSTMSQIAGLVQQQRVLAVRSNATIGARSTMVGTRMLAYVDINANSTADSGEPQVLMPTSITFDGTGHPGDAVNGATNYISTVPLLFNARGLPCVVQASGLCQNLDQTGGGGSPRQVGYVYYIKDSGILGVRNWGAITITPAGRVRLWVWNGASYSQQ